MFKVDTSVRVRVVKHRTEAFVDTSLQIVSTNRDRKPLRFQVIFY